MWPNADTFLTTMGEEGLCRLPITEMNYLLIGRPGSGKTVLTRALVEARLKSNPEAFYVFFQTKPADFTGTFLNGDDKVVLVSERVPFSKEQLFRWNLIQEILDSEDQELEVEEIASILFGDYIEDSRNKIWATAAKELFKAYILTILHLDLHPSNKELIAGMLDADYNRLFKFLAMYPPNRSSLMHDFSFDWRMCEKYTLTKKGSDILFFYNNALMECFKGNFNSSDGVDSIHQFLKGDCYGKKLFFLFDFKYKNSAKPFFRYFIKKIITERLSLTSRYEQPIIFVLDEIDKIGSGTEIGLLEAVNLGREYRTQVILSTQSSETLFLLAKMAETEHVTRATHAGFGVKIAFNVGDASSKDFFKKAFGEVERKTTILPMSRYEKSVSKIEYEPAVSDEELSSLSVGEFYISMGSMLPRKLRLIVKNA